MNRAAVSAALAARLATAAGFTTRGGRWRSIEQMQETELPAWFLVKAGDKPISAGDGTAAAATAWRVFYEAHIYALVPEGVAAHDITDPLVDALVATLDPGGREEQTLGGAALKCRLDEGPEYDGGLLGDKTWVAVPITVLAN